MACFPKLYDQNPRFSRSDQTFDTFFMTDAADTVALDNFSRVFAYGLTTNDEKVASSRIE